MFGPDYTAGCPSCSAIADGFNGFQIHLANHDVMLGRYRERRLRSCKRIRGGWGGAFPWASSSGSDFNSDYSVGFSEEQQRERGIEYNYQREPAFSGGGRPVPHAEMWGTDTATYLRERPASEAFCPEAGAS